MLILNLYPSRGVGARKVEDERGPRDSVVLRVPAGDQERVILVTVCEFRGNTVRVGFTAPEDVVVMRQELDTGRIEP